MVHLYKELQPADHFEIRLPQSISAKDRQLITLFYQPLTGAEPISLYLTFWAEGEHNLQTEQSHYYLMNVLSAPIGKIFEARIALEAIGLLRTYRKQNEESRAFVYELMCPLDAQSFFADPLLSMFLFSKIGEHAYRKLRQRFCQPVKDISDYTEVTRSFMDVYMPVHTNVPKEFQSEHIENAKTKDYPFQFEQFDFHLLQAGLSEQLVPSSALTLEVREAIAKLAFLYHLTPLDMQKVVILALDDDLKISQERLRKAASDFYKLTVSKEPPQLGKTFEMKTAESISEVTGGSKDQELQYYLETTPPIQVLKDINNGKEPLNASVQLAQNLVMQHGMPVGVVNALLEYVMLTTDMKLPKKYVETIADHWIRKNVKTAKEAMELARQEHDKYTSWKNNDQAQNMPVGKGSSANSGSKPRRKSFGREEKVPDWFYKRNDPKHIEQQEDTSNIDFEKERQKILEKLGRKDG